ncbi:MAG: hypothetical protein IJO70_09900 [Lachnospiraceae bacterium]|nr:hypothetical protein [Lachnospiraceae bacterium]
MFGYIGINKPELKIKDFDRYREYYCGLCHSLGNHHGLLGQISLSYDATFAAVLLSALYEPVTYRMHSGCVLHPVGKKKYLTNQLIDYVADMNVLLAYYKCKDDWQDNRNLFKLSYGATLKKQAKLVERRYPKKAEVIKLALKTIYDLEQANDRNIDKLSNAFGAIMSEIFDISLKDLDSKDRNKYGDMWKGELKTLGYNLGKFIYIMDAFDDVEKDIKKGDFNPFEYKYKECMDNELAMQEFEGYVEKLLMMCASDMAKSYERLPIIHETAILRNIIYSGIWMKFVSICKDR